MFYVSGDTHGNFQYYAYQTKLNKTNVTQDTAIILGDAGLNYYQNQKDDERKFFVNQLPIVTFCVHGNHEIRPQNISSYIEKEYCGGTVLYEPQYPNILFGIDGEIYNFDGKKCLVIGGAYSVDKEYRLLRGHGWWRDEQPNEDVKRKVEKRIEHSNNNVDIVLSHTCPAKYIPKEMFLPGIDQSTVDRSTEDWLDKIESSLEYKRWYCGHWHTNKFVDKMCFLYEVFVPLNCEEGSK